MNEIDCACLIHGNYYSWRYVDNLYQNLCRNLTPRVRLHVYTEPERSVPSHMIHHALKPWPVVPGAKSSWWYKIQLFDPEFHSGPLLYFDLDTIVVNNIDWIWRLSTQDFWAVRDFRYLLLGSRSSVNSSVMWFDTRKWWDVCRDFDPNSRFCGTKWKGDQDYINDKIPLARKKYFDTGQIKSWRWELHDGGYNFRTRKQNAPGAGTQIPGSTSVIVFHGNPKPHEIKDSVIASYWA